MVHPSTRLDGLPAMDLKVAGGDLLDGAVSACSARAPGGLNWQWTAFVSQICSGLPHLMVHEQLWQR